VQNLSRRFSFLFRFVMFCTDQHSCLCEVTMNYLRELRNSCCPSSAFCSICAVLGCRWNRSSLYPHPLISKYFILNEGLYSDCVLRNYTYTAVLLFVICFLLFRFIYNISLVHMSSFSF
jgi:hypothetical protein